MARRKRLNWQTADEAKAREDFKLLGRDGKNFLENIITADAFVAGDHDTTMYNMGRQSLARQILQDSLVLPETEILKNVNE